VSDRRSPLPHARWPTRAISSSNGVLGNVDTAHTKPTSLKKGRGIVDKVIYIKRWYLRNTNYMPFVFPAVRWQTFELGGGRKIYICNSTHYQSYFPTSLAVDPLYSTRTCNSEAASFITISLANRTFDCSSSAT